MSGIYHGWTESEENKAWRLEKMKARALAAELKPQMDDFLAGLGWAMSEPTEALHALLNEPNEAERQAAEIEDNAAWLQSGGAYMQGEDLGTRFIISGGEVLELKSPAIAIDLDEPPADMLDDFPF